MTNQPTFEESTFKEALWRDLEQGAAVLDRRRRRNRALSVVAAAALAVVAMLTMVSLPGSDGGETLDLATKPLPTTTESTATDTTTSQADPPPLPDPYPLGPASFIADGAAVYDLQLSDGGRFRLSLPERLAGDFTVTERSQGSPILVEGATADIEISLAYCEGRGALNPNPLGSTVAIVDVSALLCRPDELIVMDVAAVGLTPSDAEYFDLRPIAFGPRYGLARTAVSPELGSCGNCAPHGPMVFTVENVVVNSTGRSKVTAVDLDTLEERWTYDSTHFGTFLHGGEGGVFVGVDGGLFTKLDPATGDQLWQIPLDWIDRDLGLSGHGDDVWILRSSAIGEGQHWPPTVRRIDIESGDVLWTAGGYKGTDWHPSRPIVFDDAVVLSGLTDMFADEDGPLIGGFVRAFDVDTGDTLWTTDLEIAAPAFIVGAVEVLDFESGRALLVRTSDREVLRLDPIDGSILWRFDSVPVTQLDGTDFDATGTLAIDARTPIGGVLIDPLTGTLLQSANTSADDGADFACPITLPISPTFIPPEPWPATRIGDLRYWYGTDELWTVIDLGPDASTQGMKSVWWSANFPGGSVEEMPELRVVYQRLDGDGEKIVHEAPGTNAFTRDDQWFMINGAEPTTPGCWQATATYKRAQLSVIFEIE